MWRGECLQQHNRAEVSLARRTDSKLVNPPIYRSLCSRILLFSERESAQWKSIATRTGRETSQYVNEMFDENW